MSSEFERTGGEEVYQGKIFSVWRETFRHEDGDEATRETVRHPGAVGMVAYDDEVVWLVRQPRESVGVGDLLEIPAGKLDEGGSADPGENERIEIVPWPVSRLHEAIAACHDAKSLIGLLLLAQRLRS